ncbi:RodZ domain-containing protein [Okeanomitos corallinicola TIOX110]|uniref:RodZ domain-containing protein n=1 Tax=Okeanomitos corallinicola TIOX110 TaxID=3133117 RepID=A0ABZ2UXY0_9CYAN
MTFLNESQQERLKEITANLRRIRQENSISLEQISMQTHIRLDCLRALEEWRFEDLPEPVFVQGFIRHYADKLGLDGNAIANSFEVKILDLPNQNLNQKSNLYVPLFVPYILLLIAASTGLFYLLITSELTSKSLEKQEKIVLPTPEKIVPSPLSQPITDVTVKVELQGDSWLQIKADGKVKFQGNLSKGKRQTWKAKNSLTLRSGNAGAVLVSVNQEQLKPLGNLGEVKEITYSN